MANSSFSDLLAAGSILSFSGPASYLHIYIREAETGFQLRIDFSFKAESIG